jgi:hypothetical protein
MAAVGGRLEWGCAREQADDGQGKARNSQFCFHDSKIDQGIGLADRVEKITTPKGPIDDGLMG